MLGAQLNAILGTQAALAILGDLADGISAAGTGQGTATALTATTSIVTTVGAGSGVALPLCGRSDWLIVANFGANALMVYPRSGGKLNNNATNVGAMLPPSRVAMFQCRNTIDFLVIL